MATRENEGISAELLDELKKAVAEHALDAEMDAHRESERGAIRRLVASSTNTMRVQEPARPSSQRCGEPSICISSPGQGRRRRL